MKGIITGDIINSRLADSASWMKLLRTTLNGFGRTPKSWEIYRGDSFQVAIKKPEEVLYALIKIKSAIKTIKDLDVRMAAGIGPVTTNAARITESQGIAFQYSGMQFDLLKKEKKTLLIHTPWPEWNEALGIYLQLALTIMDNWSPGAAAVASLMVNHPELSQQELGQRLGISQSSVSERQSRANIQDILDLDQYFRTKTLQLMNCL